MPIEPAIDFQNEADFTSRFLLPLLRRLGYSIIAEYHGQREFGKDLVFGEIDRFGEVAYHGLQAKYQDSISQSDSERLIDDCRQAFRNPFRHPNTGVEHRIGTFVVANGGSIADNARENLFRAVTNSEHGGNVRMFDGKALLALDRTATVSRIEHAGPILSGLLLELRYDSSRVHFIEAAIRNTRQSPFAATNFVSMVTRLRTIALSHYLKCPIFCNMIDISLVEQVVYQAEELINRSIEGFVQDPVKYCEALSDHVGLLDRRIAKLETQIQSVVDTLGTLASL